MMRPVIKLMRLVFGDWRLEIYDKLNDGQVELIWFHSAVSSSKSSGSPKETVGHLVLATTFFFLLPTVINLNHKKAKDDKHLRILRIYFKINPH